MSPFLLATVLYAVLHSNAAPVSAPAVRRCLLPRRRYPIDRLYGISDRLNGLISGLGWKFWSKKTNDRRKILKGATQGRRRTWETSASEANLEIPHPV